MAKPDRQTDVEDESRATGTTSAAKKPGANNTR